MTFCKKTHCIIYIIVLSDMKAVLDRPAGRVWSFLNITSDPSMLENTVIDVTRIRRLICGYHIVITLT